MFEVNVRTKKGTIVANQICSKDECGIGKSKHNLVVLHGIKIAPDHAILRRKNNEIYISDISGTRTGVYLNGRKISAEEKVNLNDQISIGSYVLNIKHSLLSKQHEGTVSQKRSTLMSDSDVSVTERLDDEVDLMDDNIDSNANTNKESERRIQLKNEWRKKVHDELLKQIDLRRLKLNELSDEDLRHKSEELINSVLDNMRNIPKEITKHELASEVLDETIGLGPLERLIKDESISEIMVNAHDRIFYEKNGKLFLSDVSFTDDRAVVSAIERIVSPLGRRIDESSPMVDARLKDGSRVNAIIPPLAIQGPSITIRKFMSSKLSAMDLVRFGAMSEQMMDFLRTAVRYKRNIIISGGTGSGKTTLLNVLSNFIPDDERIITVEDSAELKLSQTNLVSLEARPPNQEGKGQVEIRDLVKNCLRMRPDRVVIGECRGGEALDMLQAMNTGHDGSLTTLHANRPRDCISRLEVMVMMSGMDLPIHAIREQIASAVNLIIQQTRYSDGSRRISSISEVTGIESGRVQVAEIFAFKRSGINADGKIVGHFEASGIIPEFYEELSKNGVDVDLGIFKKGRID